jgi:drug/metabolite transporter (DMT)-like permease
MIFCTALWGLGFIAQKTSVGAVGPLTFVAFRYLGGALLILPLTILEFRRRAAAPTPRQWWLMVLIALIFFAGAWLQQAGIAFTSVTNAGFLTALYVLFVPLIAWALVRIRPHPALYAGVPLALGGIYFLNGGTLDAFNFGDLLMILGAIAWGFHVFLLGRVAAQTAMPFTISMVTFVVAGALAAVLAIGTEAPQLSGMQAAWVELAYITIFSTAIANTGQAIAQQYVPPSNAAIILSAESLFAALGGALLLGERLTTIGYVGAALVFAAILVVELGPSLRARRAEARG